MITIQPHILRIRPAMAKLVESILLPPYDVEIDERRTYSSGGKRTPTGLAMVRLSRPLLRRELDTAAQSWAGKNPGKKWKPHLAGIRAGTIDPYELMKQPAWDEVVAE